MKNNHPNNDSRPNPHLREGARLMLQVSRRLDELELLVEQVQSTLQEAQRWDGRANSPAGAPAPAPSPSGFAPQPTLLRRQASEIWFQFLDDGSMVAKVNGKEVTLPAPEAALLAALVRENGGGASPMSDWKSLDEVKEAWIARREKPMSDGYLTTVVHRLRLALGEQAGLHPDVIERDAKRRLIRLVRAPAGGNSGLSAS